MLYPEQRALTVLPRLIYKRFPRHLIFRALLCSVKFTLNQNRATFISLASYIANRKLLSRTVDIIALTRLN